MTYGHEGGGAFNTDQQGGHHDSRYDIAKEFSAGFCATLTPKARSLAESDHWLAGYDAGYRYRALKNKELNEYLVSIGHEPMATVRAI